MSKHDINVLKLIYARLKKDLLLLQVKYDLSNSSAYSFEPMHYPEYKDFIELLHLVSGLGDIIRSLEPRERRNNDQGVFDDRRK